MALFEFRLPDIGEGVAEGEIVRWLVQPGQTVTEDEPMVEVMTDKATVVIGCPTAGTVVQLGADEGALVRVGSILAVLAQGAGPASTVVEPPDRPAQRDEALKAERDHLRSANGQSSVMLGTVPSPSRPEPPSCSPVPAAPQGTTRQGPQGTTREGPQGTTREGPQGTTRGEVSTPPLETGTIASACGDLRESLPGVPRGAPAIPPPPASPSGFNPKPLATPATRKLARELGIDLRTVQPTGRWGRVSSDDVRAAHASAHSRLPQGGRAATPQSSAALQSSTPSHDGMSSLPGRILPAPPPMLQQSDSNALLEERLPLRGLRKRIFETMAQSTRTAAHCTLVEECDVTSLKRIRERLKGAAAERGAKLSYLPFIVKAVVAALQRHPRLNSSYDEATQEIVIRHYYNLGIATATDSGLVVPVLRAADRLSILDIARRIETLSEQARAQQVDVESLKGGTFTISSLGSIGGLLATPLIRLPEVAILGVHKIKEKPVVREGQITIGDIMMVSLSFDHRVIDGDVAAAFIYDIVGSLEEPERLLLD